MLDWGCGPALADGWVGSDQDDHGQEHVGDIRDGLPWPDGTFTHVISHHALQMLPWAALVPALAELRRVTRPGGWLRLSVPDLLAAVDAYLTGDLEHFRVDDRHESSVDGKLCMYLSQAGATRSVFTGAWLEELCGRAGWTDPRAVETGKSGSMFDLSVLDTRPDESVFVEATA